MRTLQGVVRISEGIVKASQAIVKPIEGMSQQDQQSQQDLGAL